MPHLLFFLRSSSSADGYRVECLVIYPPCGPSDSLPSFGSQDVTIALRKLEPLEWDSTMKGGYVLLDPFEVSSRSTSEEEGRRCYCPGAFDHIPIGRESKMVSTSLTVKASSSSPARLPTARTPLRPGALAILSPAVEEVNGLTHLGPIARRYTVIWLKVRNPKVKRPSRYFAAPLPDENLPIEILPLATIQFKPKCNRYPPLLW